MKDGQYISRIGGSTQWDDATLMAFTRDTRVWITEGVDVGAAPLGDYFDMRGHLLTLYTIAKWVNSPDPQRPAQPSLCIEIGVRHGISTLAFLTAMSEVDGGVVSVECDPKYLTAAQRDVERTGLGRYWYPILGRSEEVVTEAGVYGQCDVLFLDGDHSYEGVSADLENYLPLLRSGGFLLMHDALNPDAPGVRRRVAEFGDHEFTDAITLPWSYGLFVGRKA